MVKSLINESFLAESDRLIAEISKARVNGNPQTIGRNGEILLQQFLRQHLPPTLSVQTGKYITPTRELSPQIDILILDSRFPILSYNTDGSVIVPMHAVVATTEMKVSLKKRDILDINDQYIKNARLFKKLRDSKNWRSPTHYVFAYEAASNLSNYWKTYFSSELRQLRFLNTFILRLKPNSSCQNKLGAILRYEALKEECMLTSENILSDFYYMLSQDCMYTLAGRNDVTYEYIGQVLMKYFSWFTKDWYVRGCPEPFPCRPVVSSPSRAKRKQKKKTRANVR